MATSADRVSDLKGDMTLPADIKTLESAAQPCFLWSASADRLIWVNRAAALLCGFSNNDELMNAPWGKAYLSAQLHVMLRSLPLGASRLERLKLTQTAQKQNIIAKVKSVQLESSGLGILIIGLESGEARSMPIPTVADNVVAPKTTFTALETKPTAKVDLPPAAPAPQAADPKDLEKTHPQKRNFRFAWQTDKTGKLVHISPEFVGAVGVKSLPNTNETLLQFAERMQLDRTGNLAQALQAEEPWSKVELLWPLQSSSIKAHVELAATPIRRNEKFTGFSGFGVFHDGDEEAERKADQTSTKANKKSSAAKPAKPKKAPKKKAESEVEMSTVRQANKKTLPKLRKTERSLEPHEQESLNTIAQVLSGEKELPASEPQETVALPLDELQHAHQAALRAIEELEQQQARLSEQLHEARIITAELQTILDTATDGVLILSDQGHILNMNKPAETLFKRKFETLAGKSFLELLHNGSVAAASQAFTEICVNEGAQRLPVGFDVRSKIKGTGEKTLFLNLSQLNLQDKKRKFCAVFRDVTPWKTTEDELKTAKAQAEEASTLKSDFLTTISHEIRTPLNAIIGFSEAMMAEQFGALPDERYKGYLHDIRTSGEHILSLVNDLLDLSKIEAGKLELEKAPQKLNEIALQTTTLMQPQANRNGVVMRVDLRAESIIHADERSLKQILLNLLSNAVRFTKEGGQIIVSTQDDDNCLILKIRDTGIGMSEGDLETALKPFEQIASEQAKRSKGSGLGLPITKALAEANGAHFSIKSTPGKGTLVTLRFPTI